MLYGFPPQRYNLPNITARIIVYECLLWPACPLTTCLNKRVVS